MLHHFGDRLDREGDYWTFVPNVERHAYALEDLPANSPEISIVTIGKNEPHWERIATFPNLEELTLHEPSKEQLFFLARMPHIKRLRITHARPKNIDFISSLTNIEELVLEYVSGFDDLSPLRALKKLKSLHLENLRRVKDFSGLHGIETLRYLSIDGTFDWKQPIVDFEFLRGLPNLEVLSFGQVITKADFPAFLPMLSLSKLNKLSASWNLFDAREYALLDVGLKGVKGVPFGPNKQIAYSRVPLPKDDIRYHLPKETILQNHPEVSIQYNGERVIANPDDEWFAFTGKGAGRTKCRAPKSEEKCSAYAKKYEAMKDEAKSLINL